MPTKRQRAIRRNAGDRITEAAIAAYQARDYDALHRALGLAPWEVSPLPSSVEPLGCDQGPRPSFWQEHCGWEKAQELQRELEALSQ